MRRGVNKQLKPILEINQWHLVRNPNGQARVAGYLGMSKFLSGPLIKLDLEKGLAETQTVIIKLEGESSNGD